MEDSPLCFTVDQFCRRHNIFRAYFYQLLKDPARAPRVMKAGKLTLNTDESAAEWRRRMTALTAEAETPPEAA